MRPFRVLWYVRLERKGGHRCGLAEMPLWANSGRVRRLMEDAAD